MKPFEIVVLVWVWLLSVMVGVLFASPLLSLAPNTVQIEVVKGIPAGVVALIVAGIGGAIAYNQFRVAKAKLNLDLFEKRMGIFNAVAEVIKIGSFQQSVPDVQMKELLSLAPQASYLFGQWINSYIQDIAQKNFELTRLLVERHKAGNLMNSPEHQAVMTCQFWFAVQMAESVKLFQPFLSFEEWR